MAVLMVQKMTALSVVDVATEGTNALPDEDGGTNADTDEQVAERAMAAAAAEDDRRTIVAVCSAVCTNVKLVSRSEL